MPRKSYKGRYSVINSNKYLGDKNNIIWRSTWERTAFKWCDNNPSIAKWGSEIVIIPYISPVDRKKHSYFVDLYIEFSNGKKWLVEIKPNNQVNAPKQTKGKRKTTLLQENITYSINSAKWISAREYAQKIGAEFVIFDENVIRKLNK